jgi:hypothetical protein
MIRILNSSLKSLPKTVLTHASAAIGAHHSLILSPDHGGARVLYAIGSNGSDIHLNKRFWSMWILRVQWKWGIR